MLETSARLLRLLALLQSRRDWQGSELADELRISPRTVRRDIDRLRELGYPVNATTGSFGGYRLGAGAELPPLLLDDNEAVAVAAALRTTPVTGLEEISLRALLKLEQVLPSRLRHRVSALEHVEQVPRVHQAPAVDPELLSTLAAVCRDSDTIRFDYTAHDGTPTRRRTEPHRLVSWGLRWYLVAWDLDRADWRSFRVDRISPPAPPFGPRFAPREIDATTYVATRVGSAIWRFHARVLIHAPAADVTARITPSVGTVTPTGDTTCVLETGSDSVENLAVWIGMLGFDFEVTSPPELVAHVRTLAARYARAVQD
ncbi:Predicted DNA-binding transcriptional regulator YafY, contains an HTH and WYL domains [Lentzea fradiae]|uniref:Predicted DNA-binding transcriptional regulator YafY, contains an HTH and WYL domains n=1 Tax=Lentzea fradiae TaxID=200378 RepID=A0A1G7W6U2_9PSEU|nr:YafY family protein [Lentzea fradiae]SDG67653.1 Predicted DNA-binding transcriptional regulator YafY, contains an HTH and WYL domains [Lentzea fradiae]